ncbi:hypothetical protein FDUTEX481_01615 [Tolypothrix sp. PCC 7601]|nr:hypothetical protein FDUTEX481_01615 [Tolypothrix sp. PCC 7601]
MVVNFFHWGCFQYLSVKGKRGRGKGARKHLQPLPFNLLPNQILS